jgi:transmembrane 9 superfamily protein 3
MHGFMQTCFYFGHMAMVGASLAIVCGTVGYFASRAFVVRIYSNVKTD